MAVIIGTNAANVLSGTSSADTIAGLAGSDRANGGLGADIISGGEGRDTINGGDGNDILYGFGSSDTQAGSGDINATLVSNAFSLPVFATSAPGDADRLFVIEQHTGQIRILDPATGQINATPFLDIPDSQLNQGGEGGLLGLAFHPNYATNGQFFVYLTDRNGDIEVRRYQRSAADPDQANPTGDVILQIPHPGETNHNGGWMAFGPDGYLYVSVGDGGGGGDPPNNAQNKDVLLGKMLCIDVDGDDFSADPNRDYRIPASNPFVNQPGADEIWALGLRNAWRPSFDRLTGDLYIADVGQDEREEVNFQPASSTGGENYGWKVKEGFIVYDDTIPGNPPATTPPLTDPLIDYPHAAAPIGGQSMTGGYVYRGTSPGLQGVYLFADFISDQLWTFRVVGGVAVDFANRTAQLKATGATVDSIASFAEDGNGNLYILGLDGEVFRLDPQAGAGDDADTIDGSLGNDRIHGGLGNDRLLGGVGNDTVQGGGGNDNIDGGADKDTLNGNDGNDTITGGDGADTLRGEAGNDKLTGSLGNDVLLGGAGLDKFVFTDDTQGNDRIDDWLAADDQLQIDASTFGGGLTAGALAANRLVVGAAPVADQAFGQFLYSTATGQLSWDADGTGAGATVNIVRLLNGGMAVATLGLADFGIVA